VAGHVTIGNDVDGYLWAEGTDCAPETPPDIAGHLDPVNIVFAGITAGPPGDVFGHFAHHMPGWS